MTTPLTNILAVIFDLDGTLLTSELNFTAMRSEIGCPNDQDILSYITSLPVQQQRSANQIVSQHELTDADCARWIDGAQHCVQWLNNHDVPMAIVTRNCRTAVDVKMAINQVPIKHIVTREDGPPKPDPKTLIDIAELWQIDVQNIAYVGDYLYDVQAANNAGMVSCLYATEGDPDYAHLADYIFSDFKGFSKDLRKSSNFDY